MEPGGTAPFLVLDDADLDAAVDGTMVAKRRDGGSASTAANRLFVHESVAAKFSQRLADRMGAVKLGSGAHDTVELGPLINAASQTEAPI